MKHRFLLLFCLALVIACFIPVGYATSTTLVLGGNTHTINEALGYQLSTSNSSTSGSDITSTSGSYAVDHGIRVYTVNTRGNLSEVTNGTVSATVSRSSNGAGLQTTSWSCPVGNNTVSDALLVRVYRRFGVAAWSLRASFITTPLELHLSNSTWIVYYYTNRTYTGGTTYGSFLWGNSTYFSRVTSVELESLTLWNWMDTYLKTGNFVGFILAPYVNPLGELAYGLLLLLVAVPLYNRTENLSYVAVIFVLFGGASGLLSLLIPGVALNLANVLLLVGIAILAYRLITALRHR